MSRYADSRGHDSLAFYKSVLNLASEYETSSQDVPEWLQKFLAKHQLDEALA